MHLRTQAAQASAARTCDREDGFFEFHTIARQREVEDGYSHNATLRSANWVTRAPACPATIASQRQSISATQKAVRNRYWWLANEVQHWVRWLAAARAEPRGEGARGLGPDAGAERVLLESIGWLCRAQDHSRSADGGVARDYSVIHGWASSYPETTGYIIPTLLQYADRVGNSGIRERARRMADWLVAIQMACGGFQGGKIDSRPVVPVTFNTGQILLGLAAAEAAFGGYRPAVRRAADWLIATQDVDGCWRLHPTPFAAGGVKAYETHAAWGLLEADRIDPGRGYAEAALANVRWALGLQRPNGWFEQCCLDDPARPLTHTIGYALRGVVEAYRFGHEPALLEAALRTAEGILSALRPDAFLPGRLRPDWSPAAKWVCLTGSAQIAHCWLLLSGITGDARYAEAARKANAFVRRTVRASGAPDVRGAVRGSYPASGPYGRWQYPNWAAKFLADSLMLELDMGLRPAREVAPENGPVLAPNAA